MNINNRKKAVIYRGMAAFIGIIAIFSDLGFFSGDIKISNLFYFTIISNLLCTIMFIYLCLKTIRDIKKYGNYGSTNMSPHIKGAITMAIILTMTVYHFILVPYSLNVNPYSKLNLTAVILHYLIPSLTILDWLFFDTKRKFKIYDPIIWISIPLIYIIFVFIQSRYNFLTNLNESMDKYVYVFLNVDKLGKSVVRENIFELLVLLVVTGYFIYGIDQIKFQNSEKN